MQETETLSRLHTCYRDDNTPHKTLQASEPTMRKGCLSGQRLHRPKVVPKPPLVACRSIWQRQDLRWILQPRVGALSLAVHLVGKATSNPPWRKFGRGENSVWSKIINILDIDIDEDLCLRFDRKRANQ